MRVLWRCNVLLPEIADAAGVADKAHSAGWIEGFLRGLKERDEVELGIICPSTTGKKGEANGVKYWLCSSDRYQDVLDEFVPDVLHVFGTEDTQSNKLIALFNRPENTIINIQGMACLCADVYTDGLPPRMQLKQRFFECTIKNGILDQRDRLRTRGKIEADMLSRSGHVIGRTDIDRMFALSLNPKIQYHFCNEILREDFYHTQHWDVANIKRHSIMLRSTGNPIKGLYQMLCAMPYVLKDYPDAHLYVVGNTYTEPKNLKQTITESSYNRLIRKTMDRFGLHKHVTALGSLTAQQMKDLYLQTHVVASASVIENESNVVSEAKLLGVPVVSSFVGGLPNRITHGYDGYLYPFNMPQMLAYYIKEIFGDDGKAKSISDHAIKSQAEINDPNRNIETLIQVYQGVAGG